MSGNYGDLWLSIWNAPEISNSDFITIAAAPGQTPVLTSLFVAETNKWVFSGLKVQSLQSAARSGNALVEVKDGGAALPTSDIVFENMTISSQDNAEAWSKAQWVANARNGFFAMSSARRHEYEVRFVHRVAYQQCQDRRCAFGQPTPLLKQPDRPFWRRRN